MRRAGKIGPESRGRLAYAMHYAAQAFAAALLFAFVAPEASGASPVPASTGSVCIARFNPPDRRFELIGSLPPTDKAGPDDSYSLTIDDQPRWTISTRSGSLVPDLAIDNKHLVRIFFGEKQVQSFWFQFSSYQSPQLCLIQDNLYYTWRLFEASEGGARCRCAEQ